MNAVPVNQPSLISPATLDALARVCKSTKAHKERHIIRATIINIVLGTSFLCIIINLYFLLLRFISIKITFHNYSQRAAN